MGDGRTGPRARPADARASRRYQPSHSAFRGTFASYTLAMLIVRNLPGDVHRALRAQAALHGRSTEAEVREILALAVKPETRLRLGEALAALSRDIGLTNADLEVFDRVRDTTPAVPLGFE